jgi:hypothetical protein
MVVNPRHQETPLLGGGSATRLDPLFTSGLIDQLTRKRLEFVVGELTAQLSANRGVTHGANHIGDVELWCVAARIAGHRLGIPVRTGVSRDGAKVWASEGP